MTEDDNPETYSGLSFFCSGRYPGQKQRPERMRTLWQRESTGKTGTSTQGKEYINAGKGTHKHRERSVSTEERAHWYRKGMLGKKMSKSAHRFVLIILKTACCLMNIAFKSGI